MSASYLCFHGARFSRPGLTMNFDVTPPEGSLRSFTAMDVDWREGGMPVPRMSRRFRLSVIQNKDDAENAFWRGREELSRLEHTTDTWSLMLRAYKYRGEINWLDPMAEQPVFEPLGDAPADGEPLVSMTSFGLPRDAEAFQMFSDRMVGVMAEVKEHPDVAASVQALPESLPVDGVTFTYWKSEKAMLDWAYRQHTHSEALKLQKQERLAGRTSFTRFAVMRAAGAWGGHVFSQDEDLRLSRSA